MAAPTGAALTEKERLIQAALEINAVCEYYNVEPIYSDDDQYRYLNGESQLIRLACVQAERFH